MLGSIEELEKDIEQFQQNMAASSELQMLLKQMLEQIKQQNSDFGTQSSALISRVDNLPSTIENANVSSNNRVKNDVAAEVDRALQTFSNEQSGYIQGLEQTKQQVQSYIEQSKSHEASFKEGVSSTLVKFDDIAKRITDDNIKANDALKSDIDKLLVERNVEFAEEQAKYLSALQQMQNEMKSCESSLTTKYSEFIDMLQKMNISNLYDQNLHLKNELKNRTTILMVISVISIIVGILGILI